MSTLWWVRHGPTHAKGMVGWSDIPADLSDHAALRRLSDYLPGRARVVSSDLARTRATADTIANGRPRLPDRADLREIHFGAWELRSFDEIEAEDPARIHAYWNDPGDVRPPGGESWHDFVARVDLAADRLAADHRGKDLIVVAHFGVIVTQLQRALKIGAYEAFGHKIENLSVTRLTFDGAWHVHEINHVP